MGNYFTPHVSGPYEMSIVGDNKIVLKDILIGDVWLASGQSNMAFTMSKIWIAMPKILLILTINLLDNSKCLKPYNLIGQRQIFQDNGNLHLQVQFLVFLP